MSFADTGGNMFTISDNRTIKLQARRVLRESRPRPVLVTVVYLLVILLFAFLRAKLSGMLDSAVIEQYYEYASEGDLATAIDYLNSIQPTAFSSVVMYAIDIIK